MGMPGPFELLIIGLIFLLIFGKRLPETARSLGQSITSFKKGLKDEPLPDDGVSDARASADRMLVDQHGEPVRHG